MNSGVPMYFHFLNFIVFSFVCNMKRAAYFTESIIELNSVGLNYDLCTHPCLLSARPSLVPTPCVPPGKKRSGEQS